MKKNREYFERVKELNSIFLDVLARKTSDKIVSDHESRTDKSYIGKQVCEISSAIATAEMIEKNESKIK